MGKVGCRPASGPVSSMESCSSLSRYAGCWTSPIPSAWPTSASELPREVELGTGAYGLLLPYGPIVYPGERSLRSAGAINNEFLASSGVRLSNSRLIFSNEGQRLSNSTKGGEHTIFLSLAAVRILAAAYNYSINGDKDSENDSQACLNGDQYNTGDGLRRLCNPQLFDEN